MTAAHAWQIASLVALARNDSCCLADCTALFIGKNRKPLLTRYLAMTAAHAWQIASLVALARNDSRLLKKISENHFHFSIITNYDKILRGCICRNS